MSSDQIPRDVAEAEVRKWLKLADERSPIGWLGQNGVFGEAILAEKRGPARECYRNAGSRVLLDMSPTERLVYCEGIAIPARMPFPVAHAWLYDVNKKTFIETTWPDAGAVYFGVGFKLEAYRELVVSLGVWDVLYNSNLGTIPKENLFDLKLS